MIQGMGVDIVEIHRIEEMIRKYADRFLGKVFTPAEMGFCDAMAAPHVHYSGRWAVKEAFYKALPSHCQPLSNWKSVEVLPDHTHRRPVLTVVDPGLSRRMAECGISRTHVSISHERTVCVACVVLE